SSSHSPLEGKVSVPNLMAKSVFDRFLMVKHTTLGSNVGAPTNSMFTAFWYLSGQNKAAIATAETRAQTDAILLLRLMRTNVIACLEHEQSPQRFHGFFR